MIHDAMSVQNWLGYLFVDEVLALKNLAKSLRKNPIIVNIGAGGGTSGLAFMESRTDLTLITIDIRDVSSPLGSLESERTVMGDKYALNENWYQIHDDSSLVGHEWARKYGKTFGEKVDMVFVDGDHTYIGCSADINEWLPNIKPGGIIAVHDFNKEKAFEKPSSYKRPHPKPLDGVDAAVNELLIDQFEEVLCIDSLIAFRIPSPSVKAKVSSGDQTAGSTSRSQKRSRTTKSMRSK